MLRSAGQRFAGRLLWDVRPSTAVLLTRGLKLDTGIVGLPVVPNAREVLKEKINKVLADVAEQIPEDTEYRRVLEATYNYRSYTIHSQHCRTNKPFSDAWQPKPLAIETVIQ